MKRWLAAAVLALGLVGVAHAAIDTYEFANDAERERLAAEDSQAQAEVELYRGIVAIYKALGGGWQPQA